MKLVRREDVAKRSVEETAAYWVMRLEAPGCTPADRAAFEKWRSGHPSHADACARTRHALAIVDQHVGGTELTALGERVFAETHRSRRGLLRPVALGLAAACTVVLALAVVVLNVGERRSAEASSFETAVGERSTVTLPDDSIVTLNTDTLVEVRFNDDSAVRRLALLRGQAHFEVAHDPRPFEVLADGRRIVALGTAFDIRIDGERGVLVTLVEGLVAVDVDEIHGATSVPAPGDDSPGATQPLRTVLNAGEQLIAGPDAPPMVLAVDPAEVVGWRYGQLVFRDDPLRYVVKEINRYSVRKLVVDRDDRLDAIRIGGVFKSGSPDSFVAAVEELYPVEARRIAIDRTVLVWVDETRLE
ncbi:MAG: FecR domain-containing protein [Gammaproteobacteria bacterium]|nr:FecR domain-containing protein [Gammaproteobacteria bacterium]